MNFEPHPTYEGLKRQAHALASIVSSQEKTQRYYEERANPQAAKTIEKLKLHIESERAMNELLTYENQELQAKLDFHNIKF